jgi:serine/threonine protein kinase
MYAGNPPFEKATPNDPYYKLIRDKNYGVFWKAHSRRRPNDFFSEKFRDLFVRMVAFDSEERITVEQIAKHPWVTESVSSYADIKSEFAKRQAILDKVVD